MKGHSIPVDSESYFVFELDSACYLDEWCYMEVYMFF